jgi:hypothetical protein
MSTGKEQLIEYLLENGKDLSWVKLADKFNLKQGFTNNQKSDHARQIWERYCKSHKLENFISNASISKVKRWQLPGGEWRESIHYSEDEPAEDMLSKIKKHFKNYTAPEAFTYDKKENKEMCAIINLFDAHIDKLSLLSETNEQSSLKENIKRFEGAFDELLAQCLVYNPEIIYIPVGSDFFNTNDLNIHAQTKRGTPQRIMGSAEDNFSIGIDVYRNCIDKAAQSASVVCPVIKGNHDEDKIFYMGVALEIAYENSPKVIIDNTRLQRKYYKYGQNLFGFAHGDKEKKKISSLPLIMAEERKKDWAETKFREWYLGDIHHKQEYRFLRGQDFIGCMVRFLRSVGTSDKWHYDNGYLGVPKTAEAFIWTLNNGMKANFTTNI